MDVHAAIEQLQGDIDALAGLDVARMDHPDRAALITALHTLRRRLDGLFATALAAQQRQATWRQDGARSTKEWLGERLNLDRRQAAGLAATTMRLGDLPATSDALRDGSVGLEEVRRVTRAVERVAPDAVGRLDELVAEQAQDGANATQVVDAVDRFVAANGPHEADREAALWRDRDGYAARTPTGAVHLEATLDPVGGATVMTAITPLTRPNSTDDDRTAGQRFADAVVELAHIALASGQLPAHEGAPAQVSVTVPITSLVTGDGEAQLEEYGPTTAATARILSCDASLSRVLLDQRSQPLDVGRASRWPTAAQRRAVKARDRCCIGCGSTRGLQVHHIVFWDDDGPTDLINLALLCFSCHNAVHRLGWTITTRDDGSLTIDRTTRRLPRHIR